MYHDSISMIVRDSHPSQKFLLIYWYQVTKFFCSKHGCASAFFAKSPRDFCPHADLAMFVLREVSMNTVLARYHFFPRGSEADSREELAGSSRCSGALSSTGFSVNSSNHSGRSRNGSPRTLLVVFIFIASFDFCWFMRRAYLYCDTRTLTSC